MRDKRRTWTNECKKRVVVDYNNGVHINSISSEYKISVESTYGTVYRFARQLGIPLTRSRVSFQVPTTTSSTDVSSLLKSVLDSNMSLVDKVVLTKKLLD